MGVVSSRQKSPKGARELEVFDGPLQDTHFPWVQIIHWSCEEITGDAIFRWNLSVVKEEVLLATSDAQTFLSLCAKEKELPEAEFSFGDDSIFLEWAVALLTGTPTLGHVRYALVPARLKEEVFWRRFFGFAKHTIKQHVLNSIETESPAQQPDLSSLKGPQGTGPPAPATFGQPYLGGPLPPQLHEREAQPPYPGPLRGPANQGGPPQGGLPGGAPC